jgi:hypothetical protein
MEMRRLAILPKTALVLGAGLLPALVSSGAAAQGGQVHCPPANTQFIFAGTDAVVSVGDAGGDVCKLRNGRTGQIFEQVLGAFTVSAPYVRGNLDKIRSLAPLQVGKTVSFTYPDGPGTADESAWRYDVTIEKQETITVPAGRFPTYVIRMVETAYGGRAKWERKWWYAPVLGYAIRFDFQTMEGSPPRYPPDKWQLVEIRTP